MSTHSIDLPGHYDQFVNQLILSGRYSTADEVVSAGLQLLEQQERGDEEKLASLRLMAAEGFDELDRGEGIAFDSPEKLAELMSHAGRRASESLKKPAVNG